MSEQPVDAHAAALDALRAAAEVAYTAIIDKAALSYAGRGDTARVLEMLDGGADIRAVDGDGSTLVCLAAGGGAHGLRAGARSARRGRQHSRREGRNSHVRSCFWRPHGLRAGARSVRR